MISKETWYDWHGLNVSLFEHVNHIRGGDAYDEAAVMVSKVSDHHNFIAYFAAFTLWAALAFLIRKIQHYGGANHVLVMWVGALMVFGASYGVDGFIVKSLKGDFAFPRPYVALAADDVRVLDAQKDPENDHKSFPSGHESFITVTILAMWPVMIPAVRLFGLAMIPLVAWSRMAMGMHFPADVLAGFIISLCVVLILRAIIYRLLLVFNIRC